MSVITYDSKHSPVYYGSDAGRSLTIAASKANMAREGPSVTRDFFTPPWARQGGKSITVSAIVFCPKDNGDVSFLVAEYVYKGAAFLLGGYPWDQTSVIAFGAGSHVSIDMKPNGDYAVEVNGIPPNPTALDDDWSQVAVTATTTRRRPVGKYLCKIQVLGPLVTGWTPPKKQSRR